MLDDDAVQLAGAVAFFTFAIVSLMSEASIIRRLWLYRRAKMRIDPILWRDFIVWSSTSILVLSILFGRVGAGGVG